MLLLDTCAVIWLAIGTPMSPIGAAALRSATGRGEICISPVSAWEIGMLAAKAHASFEPSPTVWFTRFLDRPGVRLAPLTADIAIAASFLPGRMHGDPADRLLVATARSLNAQLVTRDRKLLAYARSGHLRVIRC